MAHTSPVLVLRHLVMTSAAGETALHLLLTVAVRTRQQVCAVCVRCVGLEAVSRGSPRGCYRRGGGGVHARVRRVAAALSVRAAVAGA